ncbi:ATP-binding protein [Vibrio vulnificus]|uniref:ATP-binding protein n=2 Tax=Vibrio TaxID=662 RepID=UPI001A346864|nr:ATP-binding protein [Vibrio vulnificus]EGR0107125.1 ATP-binding protein [Vibrio vulnificus]EIO4079403.1 ATP-binding protein [Vibrio vulnificus]MCU8150743.1 ATP-binding protein [Vibrio vulnificus]HAS6112097.1 ATP-binding protein [Vibrio vulnificus]
MSLKKRQYGQFEEFFEKPTKAFLKEIFRENLGETDYLDFKEDWPSLEQIAKHVLAMANTGGGAIVFGVGETSAGEFERKGLTSLKDKADVSKTFKKFIPTQVQYDLHDFVFPDDGSELARKKFQVLVIEYSERILPVLCLKEGSGLKSNVVYIREGTESILANRDQLELLINARIDTEYSSTPTMALSHHLEQLKTLCDQLNLLEQEEAFDPNPFMREIVDFKGDEVYSTFINELIKIKKNTIRKLLQ